MAYFIRIFFYVALAGICACSKKPQLVLKQVRILGHYPSGSGLACYHNRIYLIGDDANRLLILDPELNTIDSVQLYESAEKRIPKNIKQDPEALSVISYNGSPHLLVVGSGSLAPYRSNGWLIDIKTKQKTAIQLDTFYNRFRLEGIKELNVEGISSVPGGIVLSNRGNKAYAINQLVFTTKDFFNRPDSADIRVVKVGVNEDTAVFNGVSGLEYSKRTGRLLLTVSTENTYSAHADGSIGKSYLWMIDDIAGKRRMIAMNPSRIIDLEKEDIRFKGHKIESVCIIRETRSSMELVLVSDDDKGGTALFRIELR